MDETRPGADRSLLVSAGIALGIGLGGFADGIVFHQILQLHHMLSARWAPTSVVSIQLNMFWDGVFHAFTWSMTLLGVGLLWRAGRAREACWCGRTLFGAGVAGWGLFNLVEGTIDHHVLGLHHVVERLGASAWDWVFLGSGVALIALGAALIRSGGQRRVVDARLAPAASDRRG
jgi:uncharacterized membrane protein